MIAFSYYSLTTGEFSPRSFSGSEAAAIAHAPDGHGVKPGSFDRSTHRVDLVTGSVIEQAQPLQVPTEVQATFERAKRDRLLAACDWRAARAFELGEPMPEAWRAYRQALRDLPDQPGFPLSVSWPDLPA